MAAVRFGPVLWPNFLNPEPDLRSGSAKIANLNLKFGSVLGSITGPLPYLVRVQAIFDFLNPFSGSVHPIGEPEP